MRTQGRLQGGDACGHFRLKAVMGQRTLEVGKRLGIVAHLFVDFTERGERLRVVRLHR